MKTPRAASTSPHLQVAYRLDALLHSMRAVARAEEHLCSLMHAIQKEHTLPARARNELRHLLEDLPTDVCEADRHAALDALEAPGTSTRTTSTSRTIASRPAATEAAARKRAAAPQPTARKATARKATARKPAARRAASSAAAAVRPSARPASAAKSKARLASTPRARRAPAKVSSTTRKRTTS